MLNSFAIACRTFLLVLATLNYHRCDALIVKPILRTSSTRISIHLSESNNQDPDAGGTFGPVSDSLKSSIRIFQDSSKAGSSFKQIIADVFAGEYDTSEVNQKLDDLIASAPCVVFIWQASPFSKKALRALTDISGVTNMRVVRLDDPWEEGNKLRAELGKRTGRTSVPSVWIGGEYVGGFDGGFDEEKSPGIVDLAFRGTLRSKLEAAGAFDRADAELTVS